MAWPLAALISAACAADVVKPPAPRALASFLAPTVLTYSRTIALPLTVDPARMTPKPSTRQRFAWCTTSGGMLLREVFVMNAVRASVVPLIAALVALGDLVCAAMARGLSSVPAAPAALK